MPPRLPTAALVSSGESSEELVWVELSESFLSGYLRIFISKECENEGEILNFRGLRRNKGVGIILEVGR